MAHGRETGSGKPASRQALQARGPELDLIHGLPSGPAACEPHQRPHTCQHPTTATPLLKISPAPQGASTHVASLADLKGMKIRVPVSPIFTSMMKALGASPASANINELYSALQTKVFDGQENPLTNIQYFRLNLNSDGLILAVSRS